MRQRTIDWDRVRRVLVVRLRSIGDTVLSTASLIALRRFLPNARIDVLLEDWVAPVLDGFTPVDNVVTVGDSTASRWRVARAIRASGFDVVFNLHGGPTATFFTRMSGAQHRVGYQSYQFSALYNHLLASPVDFWKRERTHSVEQQLALLGFVGVPVDESLRTELAVTPSALRSLATKADVSQTFALMHPAAAFATKEWATENFARTVEFLHEKGIGTIAVAGRNEERVLENLRADSRFPVQTFSDLTLPEITALASKARIFVGNDSGIAHIASAVGTPSVVIFGSSNRDHWRPWTNAANEIVWDDFDCQPCPGHECRQFGEPHCIRNVSTQKVFSAIGRVLQSSGSK